MFLALIFREVQKMGLFRTETWFKKLRSPLLLESSLLERVTNPLTS